MDDKESKKFNNSLNNFATNFVGLGNGGYGTPVNQTLPSIINNHYDLIFNNRITLNQLYIGHGLIQTLCAQPVSDAFRGGVDIISDGLGEDRLKKLQQYMIREDVWEKVQQTLIWSRLFGGAGLVILAGLDPKEPLDISKITPYTKLDFYAADLWELNKTWVPYNIDLGKVSAQYGGMSDVNKDIPYLFYGIPLNQSRVLAVKGLEAPSLMRPRMRGWGMTIVERFLPSFNTFLKQQNVIYEILDELKLDIFNLEGFKAGLLTDGGTAQIEQRMQLTSMMKNYLNILVMDKEDKFDQKNLSVAGLGDILTQNRQNMAADLKMPITKIWGVSSAGFNSGEDDLENYNSMVETEIRSKCKSLIVKTVEISSQHLFGFYPDDIQIEWKPLRVLTAEQEEIVKTRKLNRLLMIHNSGLMSIKTAKEAVNSLSLLPFKIDETDEIHESLSSQADVNDQNLSDGKDIDSSTQKLVK